MGSSTIRRTVIALVLLLGAGPAGASPTFSALVVFGDSLVDDGNARLALNALPSPPPDTPTPIAGNGFIPSAPYARPGRLSALTNGAGLAEQLAALLGLPNPGASLAGGDDFAFGSARMATGAGVVPTVPAQVDAYIARLDALSGFPPGPDAPPDALYLIVGGGNDARDAAGQAAAMAAGGASDADIEAAIDAAVTGYGLGLAGAIGDLVLEGARHIVVANVADIGRSPAAQALGPLAAARASAIAAAFNAGYDATMDFLDMQFDVPAFDDVDLIRFDLAGLLDDVMDQPGAFGLSNTADACAASPACIADPSTTLFWDGVHPTEAGHAILAAAIADAVMAGAPATLALCLAGALALAAGRRARAQARRAISPAPGPA